MFGWARRPATFASLRKSSIASFRRSISLRWMRLSTTGFSKPPIPTCFARNTSTMPPAERRRTILYLPRIVSSEPTAGVAASPAGAALASTIACARISSRWEITFRLSGGGSAPAVLSGSRLSSEMRLPLLPPHTAHTRAPKRSGQVALTLSNEVRKHSMQP